MNYQSLDELSSALATGTLSSEELVRYYLARIENTNI